MSLLTSLLKASLQFQQASPRSPDDNRTQGKAAAAQVEAAGKPQGNDDTFTLSGGAPTGKTGRLAVHEYRSQVGQDLAYVRETLRHKLAEYGMQPTTQIAASRAGNGEVEIQGRMPEQPRAQIEKDLNNSRDFRDALQRLSVNEPTLAFVDTALKLNQAYGTSNTVLDTLVSDNQQFNGLQDLVHRYDSIRRTFSGPEAELPRSDYAFRLNARA
ncbi:hypothetical protein SAMN05216203_2977 [Marinobacter daqiaonensis]|uniref:Uncharacterized protein n=1 Tax=Marinobacter daqiaonensis TaxID=650891 RepID=A0A1I6JGQ5_9GAMM|nr:hypothetical protein [Marinobacter daqiaonensis]SFR77780.1 hypothetical protein SAMN05216203_2977 [Marinobacter daqiaonensis]